MDFETMMHVNLERIFGERDPERRREAIREIYLETAETHDTRGTVRDHDEIGRAVTDILAELPPASTFSAIRPALALDHVARLQWRSGPPGGPAAVTGTDVAHFEDGRIRSLHVFLDQPDT